MRIISYDQWLATEPPDWHATPDDEPECPDCLHLVRSCSCAVGDETADAPREASTP